LLETNGPISKRNHLPRSEISSLEVPVHSLEVICTVAGVSATEGFCRGVRVRWLALG
jgi:hypothetical protein